jgi:Right handed beta helix region
MKTTTLLTTSALAIAALATLPSVSHAQALTISTPGVYVLQRNITVASGDGILITSSGVTLDLNGRTVMTTAAPAAGSGRGVAVLNAKGVVVKNGKIGGFNMNVMTDTTENTKFDDLQIVGNGAAPAGGPVEIGFAMIATRASVVSNCTVSAVNLGLIIRGGAGAASSGGNRIFNNTFVGSATPGNNVLGLCWNPAVGTTLGPVGDLVYNNHISQFTDGMSASAGSKNITFRENTIAFTGLAFRAATFATVANNNVDSGNIAFKIN